MSGSKKTDRIETKEKLMSQFGPKARRNQCCKSSSQVGVPLTQASCSTQVIESLHDAHPCKCRQSALLSLPIQTLISSRNILRNTTRVMFGQMSGHKSDHHTKLCSGIALRMDVHAAKETIDKMKRQTDRMGEIICKSHI